MNLRGGGATTEKCSLLSPGAGDRFLNALAQFLQPASRIFTTCQPNFYNLPTEFLQPASRMFTTCPPFVFCSSQRVSRRLRSLSGVSLASHGILWRFTRVSRRVWRLTRVSRRLTQVSLASHSRLQASHLTSFSGVSFASSWADEMNR